MLDDRSYMRENPHRSAWSATVILMFAVAICFALQEIAAFHFGFPVGKYLALSAEGLRHGRVWQLLTFQFLHVGLLHLAGNMLGLWFFGRVVEERLGTSQFWKLYFLCGVAGGALQAGLGLLWPKYFGAETFGASAGVLGLLAAFALLEPEATILIFFILPIKARYILWIELSIAALFTIVPTDPVVAHAAHLGGILAAIAFLRWDFRRPPLPWNPLQARRRKRQLVQAAAQITRWRGKRDTPSAELPPEEFISKEVDPILDKISAHGIHSLTPHERQVLEAARAKMGKR
jgi:membrane associated rhomboid family serine protease